MISKVRRKLLLLGTVLLAPFANRPGSAASPNPISSDLITKASPADCIHTAILKINHTQVQCLSCDLIFHHFPTGAITINYNGHDDHIDWHKRSS